MAYVFRLNVVSPDHPSIEGDFWWLKSEDFERYQKEDPKMGQVYPMDVRHWSTVALEVTPCTILPKLTGINDWSILDAHNPTAIFESGKYTAYLELVEDEARWYAERDEMNRGPKFHVFTPNGNVHETNDAHIVARTIMDAIHDSINGYNRIRRAQ